MKPSAVEVGLFGELAEHWTGHGGVLVLGHLRQQSREPLGHHLGVSRAAQLTRYLISAPRIW
ncbi:MAG TPA: hypothetical protein VK784_05750 [Pseudonocardiaceae bacterium]|nr:hypothetical protein [Pseudonocardiaceae bacterium]